MKTGNILLVMAVACAAVPASAMPATPQAQVKAPSAVAMQLVSLMASEEGVRVQTANILHEQMPKIFATDPNMQKLEQRWPGFIDECVAAMEPIVIAGTLKRLPDYRKQMASLFDRELSPGDIDTAREFFASPTGQKVLAGLQRGTDVSALLKKGIEARGTTKVAASDMLGIGESAVAPVMAQLSAAEMEEVEAFGATPAGGHFEALNPKMAELAAQFNNASRDPQAEGQIEAAVIAIVQRHQAAEAETTNKP